MHLEASKEGTAGESFQLNREEPIQTVLLPNAKLDFFFFPFWNFQRKPNESFMDCFFFLQPLWLLIHIGNQTFLFRTPTARSCATQQNNLRKCVWECWTFYRYMCQHRTHQNMALEAFLNVFLQTINIILTS